MSDDRFFKLSGPFKLGYLAELTNCELSNIEATETIVNDIAPLKEANDEQITFFDNKKYLEEFKITKAKACFVSKKMAPFAPNSLTCLVSKNPYKSYAIAARKFYPEDSDNVSISDKAIIDTTATIGDNCLIEASVVIGKNVEVGDNCNIKSNTVISDGVKIGNNCRIGANVTISHALIGNDVCIYSGVVVGSRGFGFAIDYSEGFTTVPQLGRVIIEDKVEIGANTTVDRGAGPDTVIGEGTRIDNLVQIGHNVKVGKHCIIVSQAGISGSTEVGDGVMIGGQTGIAGHLKIGAGAKIAAKSGVMRDIPAGVVEYMGVPAIPLKQYMRQIVTLNKLIKKKV